MTTEKIDITTSILRGLIKDDELSLNDFAVVLNDAFFHGEIIPYCSQEALTKVYEGIDCFRAAAQMEEG